MCIAAHRFPQSLSPGVFSPANSRGPGRDGKQADEEIAEMIGRIMHWPAILGVLFLPAGVSSAAPPAEIDGPIEPFLQKYCLRCHNDRKQGGELRLDTLARDFGDAATARKWDEVIFRMNSGEMPPEGEPQPSADELGTIVDRLSTRLREGEAARMARRGPVAHYRLSRNEYQNTVYDLLGVYYDVNRPGVFNPDPLWHGFDHVGSMLSLSPSHVEHYFQAAEEILEGAQLNKPVKVKSTRKEVVDVRRFEDGELEEIQARLKELGNDKPMRFLIWPGGRMPALNSNWLARDAASGRYRARIQVSGLAGLNGDLPHLTIRSGGKGAVKTVFDADIVTPEDKPVVLEFETQLAMPAALTIFNECPGEFDPQKANKMFGNATVLGSLKETSLLTPTAYKLFTEDGRAIYPTLLVDWIEWEGPLVTEEMQARRASFYPANPKTADADEMRTGLTNLARRAWRRPVTDAEIEPYVRLATRELEANEKFEAAYKAALVGILTSSRFYYLQEGSPDVSRGRVDDWELASRLSYFLYNSMPDDELFAAADSGTLDEPEQLRKQLRRMFEDPKFARFLDSFPYQWLQLHKVGMFPPNPELYPDYNAFLERSMVRETKLYFGEMFRENRSLREFLDSDWTMLNPRLRRHYGMPPAQNTDFERVTLRPEDRRGGLLTQASVLMLTSDGQRHRPVHRGVWLSEAIFNRTPPPPPPNVEPLEAAAGDAPKATIRRQLEAHATHATCASCHKKIDPLGFAFENYDAVGRLRTEEEAAGKGKNPEVDASGELPDGRKFAGPEAFKTLLVENQDQFAAAFIEQLATYALRRMMTIDDAAQIQAVAEASKADGYRLRTVIENFVLSDLFQKR
jgi:mono/diheme cytochrome c family protein